MDHPPCIWLTRSRFLIDGILTIPIALYGFLYFPDTPSNNSSRYFSAAEKDLAISRLPKVPATDFNLTIVKRVLCKWHWWFFTILWVLTSAVGSVATNSLFSLYLQDKLFTISQRNYYPQGINAIAVVTLLVVSAVSDRYRMRWHTGILLALAGTASGVLIWVQSSTAIAFIGFYLSGLPFAAQSTFFAWANEVCTDDKEERAVVLASMLMFGSIFTSWWSLIFYPADGGPVWRPGMIALIVISFIMLPYCYLGHLAHERELRQKAASGRVADPS